MKAIILAAGMGTRIGSLIPKPLISLYNETSILDWQVTRLAEKIGLHNICAVVGYKKEIIMEEHPELIYIYNEAYARTNTSKSLLRALVKISVDAIWLNGDVVFDGSLLNLLLHSEDSACLVDTKKCGEEEIKYSLNKQGYIAEISKQVKRPLGEAVGINLIKKKDRELLIRELGRVEDKDYFEKALENLTLKKKLRLRAIPIGEKLCREIDFPEDLEEVRAAITHKIA